MRCQRSAGAALMLAMLPLARSHRRAAFVHRSTISSPSIYGARSNCNRASRVAAPCMSLETAPSFSGIGSNVVAAADAAIAPLQDTTQPIEQLSATTTVVVFIVGIIPFVWATYEFWRRIAVGASFGTGSDSVVIPSPFEEGEDDLIAIGEDGNPMRSRGRRTLDRGALTVAYVLFAVAGGSVAIAIASVLMGSAPPM